MRYLKVALLIALNAVFAVQLYPIVYSERIVAKALPKTVIVILPNGLGSGVYISKYGHVLTCAHVVQKFPIVLVKNYGESFMSPAKVLAVDEKRDLALLLVYDTNATPATFDHTPLVRGQSVFLIGHPFGLSFTVTKGIVSGLDRFQRSLVQTDSVLNQGNSGGPMFNQRGELVGINEAITPPLPFFTGQGLTIPVSVIMQFLQQYNVGAL